MNRTGLVLILLLAVVMPALACIEAIDKNGTICPNPDHAANATCPGCSRCDTHCQIATAAAGNRCPTCGWFDVQGQCYNAACPEYSRSKWGTKPRPLPAGYPPFATPAPSPSPGASTDPNASPDPNATPDPNAPVDPANPAVDPATAAVIRQTETEAATLCERLGLEPGDCSENPAMVRLVESLPTDAQVRIETLSRGQDPAGPRPVATTGPGVDAFMVFQSRDNNGGFVQAVDPGGQPYAGLTVTATLDGEAPITGRTDSAGWFPALFPAATIGRPVRIVVGPPASTEVRDIRQQTWVVLRVPRP